MPTGEKIVISGDFNAHLGEKNRDFKREHDQHGLGQVNAEGEKLLEILQAYGLCGKYRIPEKERIANNIQKWRKYNTGGLHPCKK